MKYSERFKAIRCLPRNTLMNISEEQAPEGGREPAERFAKQPPCNGGGRGAVGQGRCWGQQVTPVGTPNGAALWDSSDQGDITAGRAWGLPTL